MQIRLLLCFKRGVDLSHPHFITWGNPEPEVASYTLKSIQQYNCWRMIEYIMRYAKSEQILKFVHNRNFKV